MTNNQSVRAVIANIDVGNLDIGDQALEQLVGSEIIGEILTALRTELLAKAPKDKIIGELLLKTYEDIGFNTCNAQWKQLIENEVK